MIRLIISGLLLLAAYMIFSQFTDPIFKSIDTLRAEGARLDLALTKANELKAERIKLESRFNLISDEQKARLEKFLPETIDTVRLLIDIDRMAATHNLHLGSINITSARRVDEGREGSVYGIAELGFTVEATYEVFLAYLADLERSLRLIDVTDITFNTGSDSPVYPFNVKIKAYWLPSSV